MKLFYTSYNVFCLPPKDASFTLVDFEEVAP